MFSTFTNDNKIKSNEIALEVLFEDYYDRVYRAAFLVVFDRELASDATQEAFLRAFKKMDTLKDKSKFGAWICTIVVNICKDMLRKIIVDRQKNISIYDLDGNIKEYIHELSDFNIPDIVYENIELRQELEQCINEQDIDIKTIINLKYYQDCTYDEISVIMDIKEGTVKSKLYRAKKKIAKRLEKYLDVKGMESSAKQKF